MHPRARPVVIGIVLLLVAAGAGAAVYRSQHHSATTPLTVTWGGKVDHPSCVYDPGGHTVGCAILIDGTAPAAEVVTVTITAYADENTSAPVGSTQRSVHVEGTQHLLIQVTVPVTGTPHVDEDGETSCRLAVTKTTIAG